MTVCGDRITDGRGPATDLWVGMGVRSRDCSYPLHRKTAAALYQCGCCSVRVQRVN